VQRRTAPRELYHQTKDPIIVILEWRRILRRIELCSNCSREGDVTKFMLSRRESIFRAVWCLEGFLLRSGIPRLWWCKGCCQQGQNDWLRSGPSSSLGDGTLDGVAYYCVTLVLGVA